MKLSDVWRFLEIVSGRDAKSFRIQWEIGQHDPLGIEAINQLAFEFLFCWRQWEFNDRGRFSREKCSRSPNAITGMVGAEFNERSRTPFLAPKHSAGRMA